MKVLLASYDNWDIVESGYSKPEDATTKATLLNVEKTTLKEFRKKDKKSLYIMNPPLKKYQMQKRRKKLGRFCKNHSKVLRK